MWLVLPVLCLVLPLYRSTTVALTIPLGAAARREHRWQLRRWLEYWLAWAAAAWAIGITAAGGLAGDAMASVNITLVLDWLSGLPGVDSGRQWLLLLVGIWLQPDLATAGAAVTFRVVAVGHARISGVTAQSPEVRRLEMRLAAARNAAARSAGTVRPAQVSSSHPRAAELHVLPLAEPASGTAVDGNGLAGADAGRAGALGPAAGLWALDHLPLLGRPAGRRRGAAAACPPAQTRSALPWGVGRGALQSGAGVSRSLASSSQQSGPASGC
jgi:hypothetical protein